MNYFDYLKGLSEEQRECEIEVDIVELHASCKALGISLTEFVRNYEKE